MKVVGDEGGGEEVPLCERGNLVVELASDRRAQKLSQQTPQSRHVSSLESQRQTQLLPIVPLVVRVLRVALPGVGGVVKQHLWYDTIWSNFDDRRTLMTIQGEG